MARGDKIEIVEIDNPEYVARSDHFRHMVYKFVGEIKLPTINYESLHNYLCTITNGVAQQKRSGVPDSAIEFKMFGGYVNDILKGFCLFYLMPNRIPHIQTIDWPYCYSEDIRVTHGFCLKVKEYKKKWGARHISLIAVSDRNFRVFKRAFKNVHIGGTYIIAEDVKDGLFNKHDHGNEHSSQKQDLKVSHG